MVHGLTVATSRLAEIALTPFGISSVEYGIMEGCLETDGITATELAADIDADVSVISRRVNTLVEAGASVAASHCGRPMMRGGGCG